MTRDARRRALGQRARTLAAAWYEAHGYEVVDRNWRCREGELDLVVRRGRVVVFCEVKTRASDAFGAPAEAVSRTQAAAVRALAAGGSRSAGRGAREIRFDVASVLGGAVEVHRRRVLTLLAACQPKSAHSTSSAITTSAADDHDVVGGRCGAAGGTG